MKKSTLLFLTIIYFITLGMVLFFFRYSIIPTHSRLGGSYKLNRLTGEISILYGTRELPMQVSVFRDKPSESPQKEEDLSFLPDKAKVPPKK